MRTTRAAIYARYSSQEQTGGESIEYQLQRCREYIEAQGLVLPEESIFVDEARSGTSTLGRDEFNRMIALAKRSDTPFDVVVAWSTSRFGRNQDEAIFNKIGLRRQGVDVKFVSQPVPDGHMGTLIERIYEWKDEFDSIQIGEYAFEGQRQVTQKGFHGGGRAPYGYRLKRVPDPEGKRDKHGVAVEYVTFEVVEDEARVVRRIFEAYAQAPGYKRIAEELNAEGVQSPSGSTWDTSGIRNVLLNETYLGKRVWNRNRRNKKVRRGTRKPKPREEWVVTENAHEAIVSQTLWDAVQEKRGQFQVTLGNGKCTYRAATSVYMLTGLLKCDECGGSYVMTGGRRASGKTKYYRCSYHANRGNAVCTNKRSVRQDAVETAVLEAVSERLLTPETVEAILEEARALILEDEPDGQVEETRKALEKIGKEIRNLTLGIRAAGPVDELVKELRACELRRDSLRAEIEALLQVEPAGLGDISTEEIEEGLMNLKHTLSYATPREVKSLLQEHIQAIRIPPKGNAQLVFNPAGLLEYYISLVTPRGVEPPSPE